MALSSPSPPARYVTISVSDPDPYPDPDPHEICLLDPDPDPAADKMSSKRQNNSYHLELFD